MDDKAAEYWGYNRVFGASYLSQTFIFFQTHLTTSVLVLDDTTKISELS